MNVNQILLKMTNEGVLPTDNDEVRLKKQILNIFASFTNVAGLIWGLIYFFLGEPLVALLPWLYTLLGFFLFIWYKNNPSSYHWILTSFMFMIFFITLGISISLGNFVNSSGVIIWAFSAPLIALITKGAGHARRWFILFVIAILTLSIINPLRNSNNLPAFIIIPFFGANIIGVSFATYLVLEYAVRERDRAKKLLSEEKQKTELLLKNVLPDAVIPHLQSSEEPFVREFEEVSVMFADIVGFTALTEKIDPNEMLALLNEIFSYFDSLLEEHKAEKIRTVGDNYMVAVGTPVEVEDHAYLLVTMAQKMLDYLNSKEMSQYQISFRIGINSGPVIAGVIGKHKFHFDIWGDCVNLASRFESHGIPNKIQIGHETYERIKGRVDCEKRGKIKIKGKGSIETWIVS